MRTIVVGLIGLVVAVGGIGRAHADEDGTCIELHCYCNGPDQPDTVASCNTTCEQVCGGGSSSSTTSGGGSPLPIGRVYFGAAAGPGYEATYDNGTTASSSLQFGGEFESVIGRESFGFSVLLGVGRDGGTSPDLGAPAEPWWHVDLGVGLATSPVALLRRRSIEIRLDFAADAIILGRLCGGPHCDPDVLSGRKGQATTGLGYRVRAGFDCYLGKGSSGIAIDAMYQPIHIGDLSGTGADATSIELAPPPFMVRVSWVLRERPGD